MPSLTLPPELSDVVTFVATHPDDKMVRLFIVGIKSGRRFDPWLPVRLHRFLRAFDIPSRGPRLLRIARTGFRLPVHRRAWHILGGSQPS